VSAELRAPLGAAKVLPVAAAVTTVDVIVRIRNRVGRAARANLHAREIGIVRVRLKGKARADLVRGLVVTENNAHVTLMKKARLPLSHGVPPLLVLRCHVFCGFGVAIVDFSNAREYMLFVILSRYLNKKTLM